MRCLLRNTNGKAIGSFVNLQTESYHQEMVAQCLTMKDFGFDGIFSRQVETLGRTEDVLIGISTSGNSKNVVGAMQVARAAGIGTIAFSGEAGGEICSHADIAICVPSRKTMHVQEAHIALGHVITLTVEQILGHQ